MPQSSVLITYISRAVLEGAVGGMLRPPENPRRRTAKPQTNPKLPKSQIQLSRRQSFSSLNHS